MAQVDAFLQLDGIKGESQDKAFPDAIEILNWSWGMTNSAAGFAYMSLSAQARATKPKVRDIRLTKRADKSSPALAEALLHSREIKSATLTMRKAGGGGQAMKYYTLTLGRVFVSSFEQRGHQNGELEDELTINFAKFEMDYIPQLETGGPGGGITFIYEMGPS